MAKKRYTWLGCVLVKNMGHILTVTKDHKSARHASALRKQFTNLY